jgi:hypothetical protein
MNEFSQQPLSTSVPRIDSVLPSVDTYKQQRAIWMVGQLVFLLAQFATLFAVYMLLRVVNYSYLQYLWTHPMGIKMAIMAFALMTINVPILLGSTLLLNQTLLRGEGRTKTHVLLIVLLDVLCLVLFLFPALFVVLMGPAYIQVLDSMGPEVR